MYLRSLLTAGTCVLLMAAHFLADDEKPNKKSPAPDEASRQQAESKIKDLFKKEYALTKPADCRAVATRFVKLAEESKEDPPTRFVLLREAAMFAAQGGEPNRALSIIETIDAEFTVNAVPMKVRALEAAAKAPMTTQIGADLVYAAFSVLVREAVAGDQFAEVPALLKVCETAWPQAGLDRPRQIMKTLPAEISEIESEHKKLADAVAQLKTNPDDPAANFAVGRYRCFFKSDWVEGLPHLAKCADPTIKDLAATDLARPPAPADRKRLADGWWELASKQTGDSKLPAQHLRSRALVWYRRAVAGLPSLDQVAAERRIAEATSDFSALTSVMILPPWARISDHTWSAGSDPIKLFKIEEGFCFLSGLNGKLEGFGEVVHACPDPDGYWYLKGSSQQFLNAHAVAIRTPYRQLFHAEMKEYEWPPNSAPVKMISKYEGFCYLSLMAGKFLGPGEQIGVRVDKDGYWYLNGKSGAEVSGRAVAVRVIDPGAAYVKLQEYIWTPKNRPIRMIHRTEGMCCLSHIAGAFRGGGEEVRVGIAADGYWYLGGKSLQPTMTARAMAITLVYTLPERDRLPAEE